MYQTGSMIKMSHLLIQDGQCHRLNILFNYLAFELSVLIETSELNNDMHLLTCFEIFRSNAFYISYHSVIYHNSLNAGS